MKSIPLAKPSRPLFYAAVILACGFSLSNLPATSRTWSSTGASTDWASSTNWGGLSAPGRTDNNNTSDVATFNSAVGAVGTSGNPVSIDLGRKIGFITFDTASVGSFTIGTTGGNTLTAAGPAGSTFQMTSSVVNTQTINAPLSIRNSVALSLLNNATSSYALFNIGGSITTGAASLTSTVSLGGINTGDNTLSGALSDGATAVLALSKIDAGTWVVSGVNTNTGKTTVNAGTLRFANRTSLYNGNTASWTTTSINVKNGATLALNVDSAGTAGFTSADVNTLLTNISVAASTSNGLQAGAVLGLDTSTATGGTFTQGNAIANSTGSLGGAIGVTKSGVGALVFDKANTYTGATLINAGSLVIGDSATGSIGNGGISVTSGTLTGSRAAGNSIGTGLSTIGNGTGSADSVITAGTTASATGRLAMGGALTLNSDAKFVFDLNSTTGEADQVIAVGVTTLDSSAVFAFNSVGTNAGLLVGQTFTAIDSTTISGQFSNLANGGTISSNGVTLQANNYTTAGDLILTVTAVPESSTVLLLGFGIGTVLFFRRRCVAH